jgi:hypothetical protein
MKREEDLLQEKRIRDARARGVVAPTREEPQSNGMPWEILAFMLGVVLLIVGLSIGVAYTVLLIWGDE